MSANELSYDQVVERMNAQGVEVKSRRIRDVMKAHAKLCPPIVYGYRTIRFALAGVDKVIFKIKQDAVRAGLAETMPHGKAAKGKGKR